MRITIIICLASFTLLAACSSRTPYKNIQDKNLTVNLVQGEDSRGGFFDPSLGFFSSVDIVAGINDLNPKCETAYKGYIDLKPGNNELGLKPEQLTYLMVEVVKSASGGATSFSRGTLIKPKKGKQYELDVNYVDSMFDMKLYEVRKSKRKKINITPLNTCKPS